MILQESGEMYLETILVLRDKKPEVRSIDISEHMGFSKPSVSRAVKLLKTNGYIEVDNNGFITLTPSGEEVAGKIYERHNLLTQYFEAIGVPKEIAEDDACKIEHIISDETFDAMKRHSEKYSHVKPE